MSNILPQEFLATEWRNLTLEAIDGLQAIDRRNGLNRLQRAALEALERAYCRTVKHRGAIITREAVARPIAIAHAAMQRDQESPACAH